MSARDSSAPAAAPVLMVEGTGCGFISQYSHALAVGLHRRDLAVRLVTGLTDEFRDWPLPVPKAVVPARGARGWLALARLVARVRPGIVHFQWLSCPWLGLALVRLWQRRGIRVVYTPHNILPHGARLLCLPAYRAWYRAMDGIVARDRHIAWALEEVLGIPRERLTVLPQNPNLLALAGVPAPAPWPARASGERRVLFFGHGARGKGLPELAGVLAGRTWPASLHLVLAGEHVLAGLEPGALEAVRRHARVTVIERYLAPGEVPGLFAGADLLVLPYLKICKSPLLDLAADLGVPVLRSDRVQGEGFREGVHGLTVPHGDRAALAGALAGLLDPPGALADLRARLRVAQAERSSLDALVDGHLRLYAALAAPAVGRSRTGAPDVGSSSAAPGAATSGPALVS